MPGKPAARLGDPTDCPKKGHGTNPIAAGSSDVLFDGMPAARMGDASACGGAMTGAVIPTMDDPRYGFVPATSSPGMSKQHVV